MAFEFHLPDIGEGLAEATIVSWLVPVGGSTGLDQPMVELETDKAIVEMPAPRAGGSGASSRRSRRRNDRSGLARRDRHSWRSVDTECGAAPAAGRGQADRRQPRRVRGDAHR